MHAPFQKSGIIFCLFFEGETFPFERCMKFSAWNRCSGGQESSQIKVLSPTDGVGWSGHQLWDVLTSKGDKRTAAGLFADQQKHRLPELKGRWFSKNNTFTQATTNARVVCSLHAIYTNATSLCIHIYMHTYRFIAQSQKQSANGGRLYSENSNHEIRNYKMHRAGCVKTHAHKHLY